MFILIIHASYFDDYNMGHQKFHKKLNSLVKCFFIDMLIFLKSNIGNNQVFKTVILFISAWFNYIEKSNANYH